MARSIGFLVTVEQSLSRKITLSDKAVNQWIEITDEALKFVVDRIQKTKRQSQTSAKENPTAERLFNLYKNSLFQTIPALIQGYLKYGKTDMVRVLTKALSEIETPEQTLAREFAENPEQLNKWLSPLAAAQSLTESQILVLNALQMYPLDQSALVQISSLMGKYEKAILEQMPLSEKVKAQTGICSLLLQAQHQK